MVRPDPADLPILMVGAGRMGGALVAGWRASGAISADQILVRDPAPGPAALASGVRLDPSDGELKSAMTVVLAVKPQGWRAAAQALSPLLAPHAMIISILAGIAAADIAGALGGRTVARVMPTTAAAIGQGAASVWAPDPEARRRARALFAPLGAVVDLEDESDMHLAVAVSGSAPAYLYAFIEALESAAEAAGLAGPAARGLARATLTGAAALLAQSGEDPAELRRQVTSPGGTTEAALAVLTAADGIGPLMNRAVAAAVARSRALGS